MRHVLQVLQWTRDWGKAQQLAWEVANAFVEQCNEADQIKEGVKEWLQALASARVPCTLVSNMSRYGALSSQKACFISGSSERCMQRAALFTYVYICKGIW